MRLHLDCWISVLIDFSTLLCKKVVGYSGFVMLCYFDLMLTSCIIRML